MINITCAWMSGVKKSVKVSELSLTKCILDICYEGKDLKIYPFLIHKGKLLDLVSTLKSQGVADHDLIYVFETDVIKQKNSAVSQRQSIICDENKNYEDLMHEALRLLDMKFSNVEYLPNYLVLFKSFFKEIDEEKDTETTEADVKVGEISNKPLPSLCDSSVSEYDEESDESSDDVYFERFSFLDSFYSAPSSEKGWNW